MNELAWPWCLALIPLPWLLARIAPPATLTATGAIRWPHWSDVQRLAVSGKAGSRGPGLLTGLAWLLLCIAAARPVQWSELVQNESSGRELLLAVDVSGSMAAEDMLIGGRRVDRLTAVKAVVGDFLERRRGDRVGLILFGQQAFLLTPLTADLASVRYQLDTSTIGLAGRETAIGDAIGLAVKRLRDRPPADRVLVLLTDGVNTAGSLSPERATELAVASTLRVHTIGMGSEGGARQGMFGLMLPAAGAEIDEKMLEGIAQKTGGRYFRARNASELAQIYAELDRLEALDEAAPPLRIQRELFHWPLAVALCVLLLTFGNLAGLGRRLRGSA